MNRHVMVVLAMAALGFLLNSRSATASMVGQCDALAAHLIGDEQQLVRGVDGATCNDLLGKVDDFVNAGCVPLLDMGQLYVSHLRLDHSLIQTGCTALNCVCGFGVPECVGVVSCE